MAEIQPVSRDRRVVCACGEKEYTVRDAIDAAIFRNELVSVWKEFLCKINAEARAHESELELNDEAVDEMAELFRYEHDLITAEETERWLEQRALTLEDFSDYVSRKYWRSAVEGAAADDVDLVSADEELRDLFTIELIFASEVDRLAKQLMWRLAARAANDQTPKELVDSEREKFFERVQITPANAGDWLAQIARDEEWLNEMCGIEAAYRAVCEQLLTPQSRQKQLALQRMPLTHFSAEAIQVESADAAKEAMLCMRQDGISMEEVASEARYPHRRITFRHEDVPPDLQHKFWSAGPGDLLDPIAHADGFEIFRIIAKAEPDLNDSIVQERIDQRLLEQHFSHLVHEHVQTRLEESPQ
ncbi:MAG TPA: hypothetical protein VH170_04340 [Chthoniobacterales bacterium]|jgi:hypothetical protein|nr:hypothetical protein [Chthoniobacterales bacterium]